MIQKKHNDERRKHPRLNHNIPLKIWHEDGDIVTKTGNISRSGAYCQVNKYIAPMTKLKINFLLPIKKNGKVTSKKISCEGAVVRTDEVESGKEYCLAIFFSDISQRDADAIADYVSLALEQNLN